MSRKPLSKKLRFTVFARDGFQCQYCGGTPPAVILEPDHVIPVSAGGPDTEENLITACSASRPLRPAVAERTQEILEAEEQLAAYRQLLQQRAARLDESVDELDRHFTKTYHELGAKATWTLTPIGQQSIRQWLRDWTVEDLKDAISIAAPRFRADAKGLFAYIGGILRKWRTEGRR